MEETNLLQQAENDLVDLYDGIIDFEEFGERASKFVPELMDYIENEIQLRFGEN